MMKLTAEQISYIEQYLHRFQIKYYEVYVEILDHLILKTESILENEVEISFEEAVVLAKEESIGKKGFADIVNAKYKACSTKIRKDSNLAVKNHFTAQNIGWYFSGFLTYFFLISTFEKPHKVHIIMILSLFLLSLIYMIPIWKFRKKDGFIVMKTDNILSFKMHATLLGVNLSNLIIILGKESIDFHHYFIVMIFSILFMLSLIVFILLNKTRKKLEEELKTQIFI